MDLVFSCPVCQKPLRVESSAEGKNIRCPICTSDIKVPRVKTARILGTFYAPTTRLARQHRKIRTLVDEARALRGHFSSLARQQADLEREIERMGAQAVLMRQKLELATTAPADRSLERHQAGEPRHVGATNQKTKEKVAWALAFTSLVLAVLAWVL